MNSISSLNSARFHPSRTLLSRFGVIDEIAGGGDTGHRAWPHGRSGRRRDREGCCAGALGGVVFALPTLPAGNVQYTFFVLEGSRS